MRSFMKIEFSGNGEITLSLTDIAQSCPSCEFFTSHICLLMLFAKLKFSQKFSGFTVTLFLLFTIIVVRSMVAQW